MADPKSVKDVSATTAKYGDTWPATAHYLRYRRHHRRHQTEGRQMRSELQQTKTGEIIPSQKPVPRQMTQLEAMDPKKLFSSPGGVVEVEVAS